MNLNGIQMSRRSDNDTRVVALGGGHGLFATLQALRHITRRLTAIVTVADNGGSSGRLRDELDVLPPGDLRMALAALCDESEWGLTWRDVLQYRFTSQGELHGHSLGNLLITGLWQILGDTVDGLDWVARLLGAEGRVLPMAGQAMDIEALVSTTAGDKIVRGQTNVATAAGEVKKIKLIPEQPVVPTQTIAAVEEAQWIVLGPGSWYTSVLPHLLVTDLREAIVKSPARRAVVMNLSRQRGETELLPISRHLEVLSKQAPDLRIDVVIADPAAVDDIDRLALESEKMGAQLLLRQVRRAGEGSVHDPLRLAAALQDAFDGFLGDVPNS